MDLYRSSYRMHWFPWIHSHKVWKLFRHSRTTFGTFNIFWIKCLFVSISPQYQEWDFFKSKSNHANHLLRTLQCLLHLTQKHLSDTMAFHSLHALIPPALTFFLFIGHIKCVIVSSLVQVVPWQELSFARYISFPYILQILLQYLLPSQVSPPTTFKIVKAAPICPYVPHLLRLFLFCGTYHPTWFTYLWHWVCLSWLKGEPHESRNLFVLCVYLNPCMLYVKCSVTICGMDCVYGRIAIKSIDWSTFLCLWGNWRY